MTTEYSSIEKTPRQELEECAREWHSRACKMYGLEEFPFHVEFLERGAKAGHAKLRENGIALNIALAEESEENFEEIMTQTIPHEVAHLIVFRFYPPTREWHGVEWQATMLKFGKNPARCHTMDVTRAAHRDYEYKCPTCNKAYNFSTVRHNRMQSRKTTYSCGICKNGRPLIFQGKREETLSVDDLG